MKDNFNVIVAKMCSLMERMDNKGTNYQGMLNEQRHINEATTPRREVSRDEIIDVLEAQDKKGNGGLFSTVVYATAEPIYTTKKKNTWRPDDVNNMLDSTRGEYGEQGWHKDLTAYNNPDVKSSTKNPIAVVCVTSYEIHWTTKENFNKANNIYNDELHNLRMSHGVGLDTGGVLGDNHNQRQTVMGMQMNQTGELSKDFNMASAKVRSQVFYRVSEDGHVDMNNPIPKAAIVAMQKIKDYTPKAEKAVSDVIEGEELEAYIKAKEDLKKKFRAQTFNLDAMLAISASVDGTSYYYINDNCKLSDKKAIPVNMEDMTEIAETTIGQKHNPIDASKFAN